MNHNNSVKITFALDVSVGNGEPSISPTLSMLMPNSDASFSCSVVDWSEIQKQISLQRSLTSLFDLIGGLWRCTNFEFVARQCFGCVVFNFIALT